MRRWHEVFRRDRKPRPLVYGALAWCSAHSSPNATVRFCRISINGSSAGAVFEDFPNFVLAS